MSPKLSRGKSAPAPAHDFTPVKLTPAQRKIAFKAVSDYGFTTDIGLPLRDAILLGEDLNETQTKWLKLALVHAEHKAPSMTETVALRKLIGALPDMILPR
jgi:hypothetical protein